MLTKVQYLEKHKLKYDKAGLSKADRSARYRQYQLSFANKQNGVVGRSKQPTETFRAGATGKVLQTSYTGFSKCTKDYAVALIDPWSISMAPCVPDNITLPSYKFGVRARGNFQIGTAGTGCVYINPYIPYSDANHAGFFTTSTYASPDVDGAGVTGINPFFNDSPFVQADFGPLLNNSRVVGCGLRARYTGTEIQRSGNAISFRSPTNGNFLVSGAVTESQLLLSKEASTSPVDRDWHYAIYRPSTPTDLAYSDPTALAGNYCMLFAVFGGQPGQSFEFDYVAWFEIVGTNLPNLTRSHSDPIGLSAVSMAMPLIQPTRDPKSSLRDFIHEMAVGVSTAMSFMPKMSGPLGTAASVLGNAAAIGTYVL